MSKILSSELIPVMKCHFETFGQGTTHTEKQIALRCEHVQQQISNYRTLAWATVPNEINSTN